MTDEPLKPGDMLAFAHYGLGETTYRLVKIDKITPSGRIVCGTTTLNPDLTIRGISNRYSRTDVTRVTPEIVELVKATRLRNRITQFVNSKEFKSLTSEQLTQILHIIGASNESK